MPDEIPPIQKQDNLKEAQQEKETKSDQPDKLSFSEIMKPTQTDQAKLSEQQSINKSDSHVLENTVVSDTLKNTLEIDKKQPNKKERDLAKKLVELLEPKFGCEPMTCPNVRGCEILCPGMTCGKMHSAAPQNENIGMGFCPAQLKCPGFQCGHVTCNLAKPDSVSVKKEGTEEDKK